MRKIIEKINRRDGSTEEITVRVYESVQEIQEAYSPKSILYIFNQRARRNARMSPTNKLKQAVLEGRITKEKLLELLED